MTAATDRPLTRRVRAGAAALVLAGALYATAPFLVVGTIGPPDAERVITVASAVRADSVAWRVGMALSFLATTSLSLGTVALYAHLASTRAERPAFVGLVVTVGSLLLYAPLLGVAAYAVPAVGALVESGNVGAMAVLDRTWEDPFIFLPFVAGALWHVGVALLGWAVWRAGTPSKPGGAMLAVAGLLGVPAFFDVILLQYVELVVLAAALVVVGVALWRHPERPAA